MPAFSAPNTHETPEMASNTHRLTASYATLARILNSILSHYKLPHRVTNESHLTSPSLYIICLEHLLQRRISGIVRKPLSEVHHLCNMERVIQTLAHISGKDMSLDARNIRDGKWDSIEDVVKCLEKVRDVVWGRMLREREVEKYVEEKSVVQEETVDGNVSTSTTTTTVKDRVEDSTHQESTIFTLVERTTTIASNATSADSSPRDISSSSSSTHLIAPPPPPSDSMALHNISDNTTRASVNTSRFVSQHHDSSLRSHKSQPSILQENSMESIQLRNTISPTASSHSDASSTSSSVHKEPYPAAQRILAEEDILSNDDTDSISSDASTTLGDDEHFLAQRIKKAVSPSITTEEDLARLDKLIKKATTAPLEESNTRRSPPNTDKPVINVQIKRGSSKSSRTSHQEQENISPDEFDIPRLPSSARGGSKKKSKKSKKRPRSASAASRKHMDIYRPFIEKFTKSGRAGLASLLELEDLKRRAHYIQRDQKIESIRMKKWDDRQKQDFKAALYKRRVHEENMMRQIYKEMMRIEKERVVMEAALEKQQALLFEDAARVKTESTNKYFKDQVELMKEIMEKQRRDRLLAKKAQTQALKKLAREARARHWNEMNAKRLQHVVSEQAKYTNDMSSDAMAERILKQFMR